MIEPAAELDRERLAPEYRERPTCCRYDEETMVENVKPMPTDQGDILFWEAVHEAYSAAESRESKEEREIWDDAVAVWVARPLIGRHRGDAESGL